jgi:hypothetical protein
MFTKLIKFFRWADSQVQAQREGRETDNWRTFKETPHKEDDGTWRAQKDDPIKNWKGE